MSFWYSGGWGNGWGWSAPSFYCAPKVSVPCTPTWGSNSWSCWGWKNTYNSCHDPVKTCPPKTTPLVVANDTISVTEGTTDITAQLLANDSGDTLVIRSASLTASPTGDFSDFQVVVNNGTVTIIADGEDFDFVNTGDTAAFTLTYTVADAAGATATATAVLTVNGVTDTFDP